jgi:hypothetical protein
VVKPPKLRYHQPAMLARRVSVLGFGLAWLALSVQLALAALVPRVLIAPAFADGVPLCHPATDPPAPAAPHHPNTCLVCPLCVSLTAVWALPASDPPIPAPQAVVFIARTALPPPATAPPPIRRLNPQPRAPPIQA